MSYRRYYFDFAAALGTLWLLFLPLALLAGQWDTFNAGLMAIVPAAAYAIWRRGQARHIDQAAAFDGVQCPVCAYLLRGLPAAGRCPECGFSYDAETLIWGTREGAGRYLRFIAITPAGIVFGHGRTARTVPWADIDDVAWSFMSQRLVLRDGSTRRIDRYFLDTEEGANFVRHMDAARDRYCRTRQSPLPI